MPNVLPDRLFISAYRWHKISSHSKMLPYRITLALTIYSCQVNCTFPFDILDNLRYRILRESISTCGTWSGIRCPSSIRLSLYSDNLLNTCPRYGLNCSYNVLRLHFRMNITWYLHSHLLWLRLSLSSISILPSSFAWRLTIQSIADGLP